MHIPSDFESKFRQLMTPEEYDEFVSALNEERVTALRVNSLKVDMPTWNEISPL